MIARSVFLAAALSLPALVRAQSPSNCIDYSDYVRPLGGVATSDRAVHVAVAGDFAYVADGFSGLQVIDVADPLNPRRAGGAATEGFAQAVAVDQGIAVVAAGSAVFIFDVSDPSMPQPLASVPATNPQGVALSGGRAFVADGLQLLVVDVSDPASPDILGAAATAGPGRDLAVDGNHVFVAVEQAGLQIINVANPTSPQPVGLLNTPGVAQGVVVSANHAYIADNWAGVAIADISNPAMPAWVGNVFTRDQAFDVALAGAYAFVADLHEGLEIIEVSDPAKPRIVGRVKTPDHAYGVALGDGYAYVADYNSGLQVIDIANPLSPTPIGRYDDPTAQEVSVSGDYACVTRGNDGLLVIDVSNPSSPTFLASLPLLDFALGVTVHSGIGYVADGSGLTIVDLSDPAAPAVMGSEATPGGAFRVALSGSLACVAAGESGLHVIDVADPVEPHLVGNADTPGFAAGASVPAGAAAAGAPAAALVCVADGEGGLQLVDVTDPVSPVITGSAPTFYPALGIATDGRYAFVATGLPVKHSTIGGLEVFDLENPALPIAIANLDLPGQVSSVTIDGPFAYLAGPGLGLLLVDISEPAFPRLIGGAGTLTGASNVTFGGTHVLVVDQNGISIMNAQCNEPQAVALSDLEAIPISDGGDIGAIRIRWRAAEGEFLTFEVRRALDQQGGAYRRIGSLAAHPPPTGGWWSFLDREVAAGQSYVYVVAGVRPGGGEETLGPIIATAPAASAAVVAWPNPTTTGTTLVFDQARAGDVELQVFDAAGRLLRRFLSGPHSAGRHTVHWDGRGERGGRLASGSYLVRLRWPGGSIMYRITLVR